MDDILREEVGAWDCPFGAGQDWLASCVPYFAALVALVGDDPDPLTQDGWKRALAILDRKPEPTLSDAQVDTWRAFVGAVWATVEAREQRAAQARAAASRRRVPSPRRVPAALFGGRP